jgi:hypothetical protein
MIFIAKSKPQRTLRVSRQPLGPLAVGLGLVLAGCDTSAGGPEYVQLAVIVTPEGDMESPQVCLPVPMMPGGRTAKDARFEPGFGAHLEAERDTVTVTFHGIYEPELANRILSRTILEDGFSERIDVETLDRARATVLLVAPCRPDVEDADAGP